MEVATEPAYVKSVSQQTVTACYGCTPTALVEDMGLGCRVLLIAFTTEDLARVTFRGFDPWAEAVLSLRVLRDHDRDRGRGGAPGFDAWRRAVSREVSARNLGPRLRAFAGADPVLAEPGQPGDVLDVYRRIAIEPYRRRMSALIETELQSRSTLLMRGGHAKALDGLGSHTYWADSVLKARSPEAREVRLRGAGLVLLPSFFCPAGQVLLAGPEERPTLVYPVGSGSAAAELAADGDPRRDLAALLGSTRATALEALSESCSTTELARRLHSSLATASQHAAVLRGTGLVSTFRCGRQVKHTLTPLGHRLLRGAAMAESGP